MLRPQRQELWIDREFHPKFKPGEAGGLVSLVRASGLTFSEYAYDPSGVPMMGVQRVDVEEFDRPDIQRRPLGRIVKDIFEPIEIIIQGEIETNFIHPDSANEIYSGRLAYAGPSGLFTHDDSFGGFCVGVFMSDLKVDQKCVVIEGGGVYRQEFVRYTDGTHEIIDAGFPLKTVTTPGFATIRLDLNYGYQRNA